MSALTPDPAAPGGEADEAGGAFGFEAIWHDVECGAYAADLPLWAELAHESKGSVLELGAGTGRVSLALAAERIDVTALERSPALLAALRERARERALEVKVIAADARDLAARGEFALVLAPMQFAHLLGGSDGRRRTLERCATALRPGGAVALAILADVPATGLPDAPPYPDVREIDGWIYSSQPIEVRRTPGGLESRRLRQVVSPAGELSDSLDLIHLDAVRAAELEAEGAAAGLSARERIPIPPTDDHLGSTVVVLEASS